MGWREIKRLGELNERRARFDEAQARIARQEREGREELQKRAREGDLQSAFVLFLQGQISKEERDRRASEEHDRRLSGERREK